MGTYSWLSFQQYQTKKAVKNKLKHSISKDQLVRLAFTKQAEQELYWEHSKEFEYRGEMYDVVTTEHHGDSTVYLCWWDNEETELNQELAELVEDVLDTNTERSKQKKKLLNFLKTLYHSPINGFAVTQVVVVDLHHTNIYFVNYYNIQNAPPSPPPKLASLT